MDATDPSRQKPSLEPIDAFADENPADDSNARLVVALRTAVLSVGDDADQYDKLVDALEELARHSEIAGEGALAATVQPIARLVDFTIVRQKATFDQMVDAKRQPALIISRQGRIEALNSAASTLFSCESGRGTDMLGLGVKSLELLARVGPSAENSEQLDCLPSAVAKNPAFPARGAGSGARFHNADRCARRFGRRTGSGAES